MSIRLSRFEMPRAVKKDEGTATGTYARFIAEPFEIGYARTIGNSLRRVLLSSIEGCAICSVKIAGVSHEFSTIPGVAEDVTDIILNLKRVQLKTFTRENTSLRLKKTGPCTVTAGDFAAENSVEVLNPRQEIATLEAGATLDMECDIRTGRGFCLAEGNKTPDQEIGRIAIDSIFSPVTPDDALKTAAAVLRRHLDVFVDYSNEEVLEFDDTERKSADERERLRKLLNMSVNEIELSVRAANCLNNANITTVGELAQKTEADMLKYRNFGKKSLNEIKDKLKELGMSLGYKFDADLLESKK